MAETAVMGGGVRLTIRPPKHSMPVGNSSPSSAFCGEVNLHRAVHSHPAAATGSTAHLFLVKRPLEERGFWNEVLRASSETSFRFLLDEPDLYDE